MNPYNNIFQYLGNNLENIATNLINFLKQGENRKKFLSGLNDGSYNDDNVKVFSKTVPVTQLKPSQNAIYLEKCINPIVTWEKLRNEILGGLVKADSMIISSDNYIIDGHHRWASSILLRRNCKVNCTCINIPIKYALPILNAILISLKQFKPAPSTANNIWSVSKSKNDIEEIISNIVDRVSLSDEGFTISAQPKELFEYENYNDPVFITIEGKVLDGLYKLIYPNDFKLAPLYLSNNLKKIPKPEQGFPPRKQMPQFTDKTLDITKRKLQKGEFDIKKPGFEYSQELAEIKKSLSSLNKRFKILLENGRKK